MLIRRKQLEKIIKNNPNDEMKKIYNMSTASGCKGCLNNAMKKQLYNILVENKKYRCSAMDTMNTKEFHLFFRKDNKSDKKLYCITREQ